MDIPYSIMILFWERKKALEFNTCEKVEYGRESSQIYSCEFNTPQKSSLSINGVFLIAFSLF